MHLRPTLVAMLAVALLLPALRPILFQEAYATELPATPGGFLTQGDSQTVRPRLSADQLHSFIPTTRGPFTFPAPYGTSGARLTEASDCNGTDCVTPVGYSYWRNINQHTGSDELYFFLTLQGAGGPTLFRYHKPTGAVTKIGPLFGTNDPLRVATAEGWYFSATLPNILYVNQGSRMMRYDIFNHTFQTVFDVANATNVVGANRMIWQMHSSNDDRVHSATVKDASSYASLGCMVYDENMQTFRYWPAQGTFDECNLDKSGRWLLIIENLDGAYGEDSRIIDLSNGNERIVLDQNGAAGHADLGYGTIVAADNWNPLPNATRAWQLNTNPLQSAVVHFNRSWNDVAVNHISYENARQNVPLNEQFACGSSASRNTTADEIVCFRLDGSNTTLVVAPVMTNLNATGGGDDYSKMPKGNLDITGEYFIWTTNMGTNRTDAFLVKVPGRLLVSQPVPTPTLAPTLEPVVVSVATPETTPIPTPTPEPILAPAPVPAPSPAPTTLTRRAVRWMSTRNVTITGGTLRKNGGCDGCEDAGAISRERISSGNGSVSFRPLQANTMLAAGLSTTNTSTAVNDIEFAVTFNGAGSAEVRENGAYRADISYTLNDLFTIAVVNGRIEYRKNGVTFYTSTQTASAPLFGDTAFLTAASSISRMIMVF